ncbi:phage major tail tube protein [Hydrogenophaga electricum]|uniref:Major tail tube protein n=1 Tax=Hydrogenophaga electricum TaxID=1230953 RepID=A0ABQ6C5Y9_9BURK|nr:phage major tail tube protein [Hydrogenophaga electricum]GLS13617.1 major tail tube protein [Hydrogenophaga electricum]
MKMPYTLKAFNFFSDGDAWKGLVDEIELPKIKKKIEDHQGAGMVAPAPMSLGYEALEMAITLGGVEAAAIGFATGVGVASVVGRFSGAYQRDDTCAVSAVDIYVRGTATELDPGTAKQGEKNKVKLSLKLSYIRFVMDGAVLAEVDALNTSDSAIAAAIN